MIKKILIVLMLVFGLCSVSLAAEKKENAKEQEKPKAAEVRQDEEMAKKINEAEKTLNNIKWQVNFSQITQLEKKEKFADAISFKDNKVEVGSLMSQGFSATSFTITLKGDTGNIIVWETMQKSEKKGIAFLKGEIEEGRMRGVLSRHVDEKTVKDYSFSSTGMETMQENPPAAPAEEVKKEETAAANAPDVKAPAVPASEEKDNKKKKGKE
jgi:hypothetical protein